MKILLNALNIRQQELADATGIPKSSISLFASGRRDITHEAAAKICLAFPRVNLSWLLKGEGDVFTGEPAQGVPAAEKQAEVERLEREVKDLKAEIYDLKKQIGKSGWDWNDPPAEPVKIGYARREGGQEGE